MKGHFQTPYHRVLDDLDALSTLCAEKRITLVDFTKHVQVLTGNHMANVRGFHGKVKALLAVPECHGSKVYMEHPVPTARKVKTKKDASVDIFIQRGNGIMVEVKYYDTDHLGPDEICLQFIERDLYNATSPNQIIWMQVGGNAISHERFMEILRSKQGRDSLGMVDVSTAKKFFGMDIKANLSKDGMIDSYIEFFSYPSNFNKMFRKYE